MDDFMQTWVRNTQCFFTITYRKARMTTRCRLGCMGCIGYTNGEEETVMREHGHGW